MTGARNHYSTRDLQSLRLQLERGDLDQRAEAVRELARVDGLPGDLVSMAADQFRRGLRVASANALALLEAYPDPCLYESIRASGSLARLGVHEKCRLLVLRLGNFEDDLCTYVYRHWREGDNVWVRFAVAALCAAGAESARTTLSVVIPELAEQVNTLEAARRLQPAGKQGSWEEYGDLLAWRGAAARLEQVRTALGQINARLMVGEGDARDHV